MVDLFILEYFAFGKCIIHNLGRGKPKLSFPPQLWWDLQGIFYQVSVFKLYLSHMPVSQQTAGILSTLNEEL